MANACEDVNGEVVESVRAKGNAVGVVVVEGVDDVDEVIGDASRVKGFEEKDTSKRGEGVGEVEENGGGVLAHVGSAEHGALDLDDVVGAVFVSGEASLVLIDNEVSVSSNDVRSGGGDEFVVCVGQGQGARIGFAAGGHVVWVGWFVVRWVVFSEVNGGDFLVEEDH